MCLLSKVLGKTFLWVHIIGTPMRDIISSPAFIGLSFSILVCCVAAAYGALKLTLK